jgi:hypothetical protein
VDCIRDDSGEKVADEEDIARVFTRFFQDLFTISNPERISEAVMVVQNRVTETMRGILDADFTEEEVLTASKQLKPHAAPGPDGCSHFFTKIFGVL